MMDRKPNNRFDFREFFDTPIDPLEGSFNPMEDVLEITVSPLLDTQESCRCGKIVKAPDRLIFSRESSLMTMIWILVTIMRHLSIF